MNLEDEEWATLQDQRFRGGSADHGKQVEHEEDAR